jgi:MFS family permease
VFFALRTTHALQLWEVYLLALALGVATSVEEPASSAFLAELVGRDDLPNAIALNALLTNLVRILGAGLAGLMIAVGGVDPLFLLNALSFIVALIMLAVINPRELYGQPSAGVARQRAWQSLREGIDYVRQSTAIMLVISVVGLALLWGANFTVIMPIFATDVRHVGAQGYGALVAAVGVGALCGGIWLAWNHRRPTIQAILLGVWLFGVLEIGFALSPVYLLSLLFLASIGCIETIFSAHSVTALQSIAPDRLRGRVMSVFFFSIAGSAPLGFLLSGWLTAQVGAPKGLLICAALILVTVACAWRWRRTAEQNLTIQTAE